MRYPLLAQAKLDGIRGVYWKGTFYSRTLKPIAEASVIRAELAKATPFPFPLDGELFVHRMPFSDIVRVVHADDAALDYVVYDCMPPRPAPTSELLGFHERETLLKEWFAKNRGVLKHVKHLPSTPVASSADVHATHAHFVAEGYEGIILRSPTAAYEHVRSKHLLKLKSFQDDEFQVVGFKASAVNTVVWLCRTRSNKTFYAKPKGSNADAAAALRSAPTRIGQWLTVSYQELSAEGIPRFPVALHFRPAADLATKHGHEKNVSILSRKRVRTH